MDTFSPLNTSTPLRSNTSQPLVLFSPIINRSDQSLRTPLSDSDNSFEYLSGVRNRPRRIIYSDESDPDLLRPELPERWKIRPIKCLKFVDDCLSLEKLHFKDLEQINVNGDSLALSRAVKTQQQFRTIEYNASNIGMQINNQKTKMLCVSAARSYTPKA